MNTNTFTSFTVYSAIVALAVFAASTANADWTQFRGDDQRSAAPSADIPAEWGDAEILWKTELPGRAASSPIVVGDKVIATSASGYRNDRLHVASFDETTGKQLWHRQFWATGRTLTHPYSSVAANTPTSDGEHIYAFFSSNDLICLDLDGNLKWYRGITHDYPAAANDVGMSASPLVVGNTVVVQVENENNSLAMGLDKTTGAELWKHERPKAMNWASPGLYTNDGKQFVLLQSSKYMTAHDPKTGKEVFRYDEGCSTIVSPIAIGEEIYVRSGDGINKIVRKGTTAEVETVWSQPKLSPSSSSPVMHDGMIYTVNRAGVVAAARDSDGEIVWQQRLKGPFWATPVLAGNKLFCFNDEGVCQVIELGDKGEIVATNELGDKVLGSPAVSGNALVVRSEKFLWKIGK